MTAILDVSAKGSANPIRGHRRPWVSQAVAAVVAGVSTLLVAPAAVAQQDAARGRVLYETYCGACHYEKVHERPRSRSLVKSQADLRAQVMRWAPQTMRAFTTEEIEAVVSHLNNTHYKLAK